MSESEPPKIRVAPAYWITHDDKQYILEVELPGVSKENIELDATEESLCVKGTREDIEYTVCWSFAHAVDPKKAEAEYKEGILTLKLPFRRSIKTSKIPVK